MQKLHCLTLALSLAVAGQCQKIYGVVNITTPYSTLSNAKSYSKVDFRPSFLTISFAWRADIVLQYKRAAHKFSFFQLPVGIGYRLSNKFKEPTYPGGDTLLGFFSYKSLDAIDHYGVGYSFQQEGKKEKGFLFHSRILFNWSLGFAAGLNRSKTFYRKVFPPYSVIRGDPWTYNGHEIIAYRNGPAFFLTGSGGFDFVNRKGKKQLSLGLFYYKGLRKMLKFNMHYFYGYYNDPQKQVDVPVQKLFNRGTTFGLSAGIPITIKK